MRPVSTSFLNTVRGAHRAVFRARIVSPGLTGTNPGPLNPDGSPQNEIPIGSGDVTFDTTADVNGTTDITTSLAWPATSTSLGNPYGQELYVERGVMYGNGIKEYVGLGYFRIDAVEQNQVPKGTLRLSGSDRMAYVRDARNMQPVVFSAGSSLGAVIDFVVGDAVPGGATTAYDFDAYGTLLQSQHVMSEDRLRFLSDLLTSYSKVGYFRYDGVFQVKTAPTNTTTPVFTINSGRLGVLVSMARSINRDGVYNGVIATGEAADDIPPVYGIAIDGDPTSPTYWYGNFGKVPRFFSSSFMTTTAQCQSAAASLLVSSTGLPYVVTMGVVPNPALEGWDVVAVQYDELSRIEAHIIEKISYSLSVDGPMGIDTRKQYRS
jgi:hypothetical protein